MGGNLKIFSPLHCKGLPYDVACSSIPQINAMRHPREIAALIPQQGTHQIPSFCKSPFVIPAHTGIQFTPAARGWDYCLNHRAAGRKSAVI
jgi:hypothetical protein